MGYTIKEAKGIEINGKVYPCDPSDYQMMHSILCHFPQIIELVRIGENLRNEFVELSKSNPSEEQVNDMLSRLDTAYLDAVNKCKVFIEGTLGEEEYIELFGERRQNLSSLVDLCTHIYNWANEDRREEISKYLDIPVNREQRRKSNASKKTPTKNIGA